MDKVFIRNFIIFVTTLLLCSGTLSYFLIEGERNLGKSETVVEETYKVITEAEQLLKVTESMLSAQRAYLLTQKESFLQRYENNKNLGSNHIARLTMLNEDDPEQLSRIDEIRQYFQELSLELDKRASTFVESARDPIVLDNVEYIDTIRNNIFRLNQAILEQKYHKLNGAIRNLEDKKEQYFEILLISVGFGTVLILILNTFLLQAQRKRSRAETNLKGVEERLSLAIDGTQDGIFDWNIKSNEVFYSRRFFEMLGYDAKPLHGSLEDFTSLLHPEDKDKVNDYMNEYLKGNLSEYIQEFRMKHKSGRWVWIQSRAKAVFDRNGNALRMVGAHTDITSVIKTKEKLETEKNQALEANKAKSEFLAHMSHEIRTPLTAISGIAEILVKQKDKLNKKQAQLVKTLQSSTASLKELINDILDFSKIESGELELNESSFELDTIFEETISMMAVKANEKGVSFVFDYEDIKEETFYGDGKRIRQILVNLIGNAIKFTDQGGVTVQAYFEDRNDIEFLRIDISDTGIGISPEDFDLVFDSFKQADSSVSRKYGGTGLGLPISRKLALFMGGDIFLSSELGKGSTFSLLLPLKKTEKSTDKNNALMNVAKLNEKILLNLNEETKVLIVEDYEGNIVVIGYILDEIGLDYDIAKTGLEALEKWKKHHYDLILMDVQMPEMDGFTATKEIRKVEADQRMDPTPIIGMTAHALVGDKDKCIAAGMDSYLPKPIVEPDLKREILKYLNKKKKAA